MKFSDIILLIFWALVMAGGSQLFSSLWGFSTFVSVLLCVVSIFFLCVLTFVFWAVILRCKAKKNKKDNDLGNME